MSFVSVVRKGSTEGTMTNTEGVYRLSLPEGSHTIVYQHLGYRSQEKTVAAGKNDISADVVLEEQSIRLAEVSVQRGKEDPAYTIMRKAIAKSRIHDKQVLSFEADTYIRNTLLLNSIPFVMRKELAKEGIREGIPAISESLIAFSFQQPNKRFTRVKARKSSALDNTISISDQFYLINFYDPMTGDDIVSPLSPKAFSYYRFEYIGFFEDRGVTVNKISVQPKQYGQGVWKGTIYIIEGEWRIHSAEVETIVSGLSYHISQLYAPAGGIWMPVNQQIELSGKILGFDFRVDSRVSPKYTSLRVDPKLAGEIQLADEKVSGVKPGSGNPMKGKTLEETLTSGKTFSLKEMNRMVKMMEQEERAQRKKNGEDLNLIRQDSVVTDSLALRRPAGYWEEVRSIPLTPAEHRSYDFADSIRVFRIEKKDSLRSDSLKKTWKKFVTGHDFGLGKNDQSTYFLKFTPPYVPFVGLNYHTAEGMTANLGLVFREVNNKRTRYQLSGDLRYAFGLQRLTGKLGGEYHYGGHTYSVGGGTYKAQFDEAGGPPDYLNTIATFFGLNLAKIYMKDFLTAGYGFQRDRRFRFRTDFELADRYVLHNLPENREWIHNKRFTSNLPRNLELGDTGFPAHRALLWRTELRWQPGMRYRIQNGVRIYRPGNWPAFTLSYNKGMEGVRYDYGGIRITQQFNSGWAGTFRYGAEAGSFFNNKRVYLMDMKHLNSITLSASEAVPENIFAYYRLLNTNLPVQLSSDNYYTYSTKGDFVKIHALNEFRSLLVTRIPAARLIGLKEDLFINYLNSPVKKNYLEAGYGIDGIFKLFRLEFIAAFEQGVYQRWGWQIGATF